MEKSKQSECFQPVFLCSLFSPRLSWQSKERLWGTMVEKSTSKIKQSWHQQKLLLLFNSNAKLTSFPPELLITKLTCYNKQSQLKYFEKYLEVPLSLTEHNNCLDPLLSTQSWTINEWFIFSSGIIFNYFPVILEHRSPRGLRSVKNPRDGLIWTGHVGTTQGEKSLLRHEDTGQTEGKINILAFLRNNWLLML